MKSLLFVSLLSIVSLACAGPFVTPEANGSSQAPTPQVQATSGFSQTPTPQAQAQVGPLSWGGLYCWSDVPDSSPRYGRFALFNPTEHPIRARVAGESMIVRPGEDAMSDGHFRGNEGRCEYTLSIDPSDEENDHLDSRYEVTFQGTDLLPSTEEGLRLAEQFFQDIDDRNLSALQSYTEPPLTSTGLASFVSWRSRHEPVVIELTGCDNPLLVPKEHYLVPETWDCQLEITYAVLDGSGQSGVLRMSIEQDFQTSQVKLSPGSP